MHRIIKFNCKACLKSYIDKSRREGKCDFEKNFEANE